MRIRLRLDNIQGNVTPGFRKDHQALIFVRFPDRRAARRWLSALQPEIASAKEVATFNQLFRFVKQRQRNHESRFVRAVWVNVAVSYRGLQQLGAEDVGRFPGEFVADPVRRAERLGDGDAAAIADWDVGGTDETEPDALVILGADTIADLRGELERQQARLLAHGVKVLKICAGATLGGGREHFGFRDSVSQPDPSDPLDGWEANDYVTAPGEFILGYRDERGRWDYAGPRWAKDGSYVVFRELGQDVAAFREAERTMARQLGIDNPCAVGARLLGRWRSGAPIGSPTELIDPGWPGDDAARLDHADLERDPGGRRIPRFAHTRKAYPRDLTADPERGWLNPDEVWRHRLIRRAIPYGAYLEERSGVDGPGSAMGDRPERAPAASDERGLLFLAYQASIKRQFEHIHNRWFRERDSPRRGDGRDPLVGGPDAGHQLALRLGDRETPVPLARFVDVRGSGYLFAPSIRALRYLADPEAGWFEEEPLPWRHFTVRVP